MADIVGTIGDDTLTGTASNDTIAGLSGNDIIDGGDGADYLDGGTGNDSINGGSGDDYFQNTTGGADSYSGGAGNDFFNINLIDIAAANIFVDGGDDNDRIYYYAFNAGTNILNPAITGDQLTVLAGAGNDLVTIRPIDQATIDLGTGDDFLSLDWGANSAFITLGTGSDLLELASSGFQRGTGTIEVTDFQGGAGGDVLHFVTYVDGHPIDLFSGNAYALGYFKLQQVGADVIVRWDYDGNSPGTTGVDLTVLRNIQVSALTVENLGFDPGGAAAIDRTVTGTAAADHLLGRDGNDTINGLGGDDDLFGWHGNDTIYGDDGRDIIDGGFGNDTIYGGADNDQLRSYADGNDTIYGDGGDDIIDVSRGTFGTGFNFQLNGGDGNDSITYFQFSSQALDTVTITGGAGNDSIMVWPVAGGTIDAGDGDDNLLINQPGGAVSVSLGLGLDTLRLGRSNYLTDPIANAVIVSDFVAGSGGDLLDLSGLFSASLAFYGPALGADSYHSGHYRLVQSGANTLLQIDANGGGDEFVTFLELQGVGASSLLASQFINSGTGLFAAVASQGSAGADIFAGTAQTDLYYGGVGDDTIVGNDGDDVLAGEDGNDTIEGGAGADVLLGGLGNDTMRGGAGNDNYWVDNALDQVEEQSSGGEDTIVAQLDWTLGSELENLVLAAGSGALVGTGNSLANHLTGNSLSNELNGLAGDDVLDGGGGVDDLLAGAGNDRLLVGASGSGTNVDGGADTDTLVVSGAVSLGTVAAMEAIEFVTGSVLALTGSQFNTGFAATSVLSGTGSLMVNMVAGLAFISSQMAVAGTVATTVNGSADIDVIKVALNSSVSINGGDSTDQIRGSNLADAINGGNGNDKIMGLSGADNLTGGAGGDQFRYLFKEDSLVGSSDRILDFSNGQDRLDFRLLDADPVTPGRQTLSFIGTSAFATNGTAQLRYGDSGADTLVQIDLNGDGAVDMEIVLASHAGQALAGTDFLF